MDYSEYIDTCTMGISALLTQTMTNTPHELPEIPSLDIPFTQDQLRSVCAFCRCLIREATATPVVVSHGACDFCAEKLLREIDE